MDKKHLIGLLSTPLLIVSFDCFAERPAAEDESSYSAPIGPVPLPQEDMRPAATAEPSVSTDEPAPQTEQVVTGDTLTMPETEPEMVEAVAQPVRTVDFPRRGMTQDRVQNELGRPVEIVPPVGQPPITRWVYDDRVVFFEYSSVIHVVAK